MSQPSGGRSAWYTQLHWQVLIALVAGVVFGTFAPSAALSVEFLGDLFLRLLKMIIIPIIFTSLGTSDGSGCGRSSTTRCPPPWRSASAWRW